jgi:hypothetical protein
LDLDAFPFLIICLVVKNHIEIKTINLPNKNSSNS